MDVIKGFFWLIWRTLRLTMLGSWAVARFVHRSSHRLLLPPATTFGSARWANFTEIWLGGVWGGKGLILGKKFGRFIRLNSPGYALVFAPTRTGKGTGIVIPNLIAHNGSVICNDIKSENYAIAARDRARRGPVWTLNLIQPELSDGWNPLDMVRVGTIHEADDALEIARLLVIPDLHANHWDQRAMALLQLLILYVIQRYRDIPDLRNLSKVRSLVSLGWDGLQTVFAEAAELGPTTLRELGSGFLGNGVSDEARSIWSNADKAIGLFASDRPAGLITTRSSFDMMSFNRTVASLFLMVDEEKVGVYGGFLRVIMGCALMAMTRAKTEAPPKTPTLFLLDEAAALGRLEPLETGVGYLATYARLVLVFQDLDQLERTYPKARSIIANATAKVAFAVNDLATAKLLSESIGKATTHSRSSGQSQRNIDVVQHQTNQGRAETGRYLIDPSEVMRLPRDQALIFFNGAVSHPILATKVQYFKIWRWWGRWDRWRPAKADARPPRRVPPLPFDLSPSA